MVIGNLTQTEESAIHRSTAERGALGTLAAGREAGMHKCFQFFSQTALPNTSLGEWGEGTGKKWALSGKFLT